MFDTSSPVLAIARAALEDLSAERFASIHARMDGAMAAGLPEAELRQLWRSLIARFGALEGAGAFRVEPRDGFAVAIAPIAFASQTLDLRLSIKDTLIVGLYLAPSEPPASAWTAPTYVDLAAFREVEVSLGGGSKPLPGTLSLPNATAPAPAAVLIHGSGPGDRDQTQGPNRPFRDIAAGLATRGIATLRFEKRTKAYPGDFAALKNPTVKDETLDDALLALALVKSRPEIDSRRIIVLGHSLGATLAPRIASLDPEVAAIVMLAAAARPLPTIVREQTQYLMSLKGAPTADESETLERLAAEVARVESARPGADGEPFMGAPLSYWADLNVYDPVATAARLNMPVLILQGGRDYQVTRSSYDRFVAAFADAPRVEMALFPKLNHLFMAGDGTPSDYDQPGHVDAAVVETISHFLQRFPAPHGI